MTSGEWLPPPVPFEVVRRGYAPDQVTAHLEKLEYDLRIATANRDATTQRLAELAAQLSAAQNEADGLRAQLDRMALEPVSMASLSDRMQRMIRIAEEEAAETRAKADSYAAELRERADRETGELRDRTDRETAERRAKVEADAAALMATLQARQVELDTARTQFDVERDRTRTQLGEQIRDLIAEATAEAEVTRTRAREDAQAQTAAATATAEQTVADARAEAERLDTESAARRAQAEEDFTLALNARRTESHEMINTQERAAVTDASARIHAASTHAAAVVAAADQHAATVVARSAAESHQRVAEADAAVNSLTDLRSQLLGQLGLLGAHLDQVRTLVAQAAPIVVPPEQEADRPVAAHFPPDPADRPTPPPGFDPEAPQWTEPQQEPFVPPSAMAQAELAETAEPTDSGKSADGEAAQADVGTPTGEDHPEAGPAEQNADDTADAETDSDADARPAAARRP